MSRSAREHRRLAERGCPVHGNGARQVIGALLQGELAQCQLHVNLNPQRPQTHEAVDGLAGMRIVVKIPSLQHHLFGIEAEAFISAGVVVVATDRIGVVPAETELEVVSRHALVHEDGSRIVCLGKLKEAQVRPGT